MSAWSVGMTCKDGRTACSRDSRMTTFSLISVSLELMKESSYTGSCAGAAGSATRSRRCCTEVERSASEAWHCCSEVESEARLSSAAWLRSVRVAMACECAAASAFSASSSAWLALLALLAWQASLA